MTFTIVKELSKRCKNQRTQTVEQGLFHVEQLIVAPPVFPASTPTVFACVSSPWLALAAQPGATC